MRSGLTYGFSHIQSEFTQQQEINFVKLLNRNMVQNDLQRILMSMRNQNIEVYKIINDLHKKVSNYKLKLIIIYFMSYINDFLLLCKKSFYLQIQSIKQKTDKLLKQAQNETVKKEILEQQAFVEQLQKADH
jgi:hypothetical protein